MRQQYEPNLIGVIELGTRRQLERLQFRKIVGGAKLVKNVVVSLVFRLVNDSRLL